ncbi:NAD-dependent epimerase/dehydratase family protein [Streptomyces sp. NPDC098789]|uniref:NAD-dependent epimerase/dehydratase family protein n=1 Tax=Streptomyces sp. NPDC098789 TaxID=3366098 RepID=UPI0038267358
MTDTTWSTRFSGRHVMVTGATGFLGSNLTTHLLDHGAKVSTLVPEHEFGAVVAPAPRFEEVTVQVGTIADYAAVDQLIRDQQVDTVFHLAAIATTTVAHYNPRQAFDTNIQGTYNILEACRVNDVARVVVASSDKAYGNGPHLPYTEDMPMAGQGTYDVSKSCADLLARSYHTGYGLPVAVGRYGNIFGECDLHWSRLIPGTIRRLHHGQAPVVRQAAAGPFSRDFLYVADAVTSYLAMAAALDAGHGAGQAYNFAMGLNLQPVDVVRRIQHLMGRQDIQPVPAPSQPGEIAHQQIANDKAARTLDWTPAWTLDEGLARTVDWYRTYLTRTGLGPII